MGMISKMDHTGDTAVAAWDATDEITVEEARRVFDSLVQEGYLMVRVDEGNGFTGEKVKEFDVEAERVVAFRQMAGG